MVELAAMSVVLPTKTTEQTKAKSNTLYNNLAVLVLVRYPANITGALLHLRAQRVMLPDAMRRGHQTLCAVDALHLFFVLVLTYIYPFCYNKSVIGSIEFP
jgi:hypothetical protein